VVAVLVVATKVGCYIFLSTIDFDGGVIYQPTSSRIETATQHLHMGNITGTDARFSGNSLIEQVGDTVLLGC
jgi:hypothetical protein